MANRFSNDKRLWVYRYLAQRDGEICALCGKKPKEPGTLEIHHKDNNKNNDDPVNLQLAHGNCNRKKEIEFRSERKKIKTETISLEGSPATRMVRAQVDYSTGSAEMQANGFFETSFRKWLLAQIKKRQGIELKEAKNSGAEVCGCSPSTTLRYIDKLLSETGPLKTFDDMIGTRYLMFKDKIADFLETEVDVKKKPGPKPEKKVKEVKNDGEKEK